MRRKQLKIARPGLTLVELLVVLAILALLATVAITSTDLLMGQGRYEATVRTLDGIGRAIVDSDGGASSSGVTGFVADTGRLPASLDELFQPSAGMVLHQVWEFDSDDDAVNDIRLASGWRGPYLRLAPGQDVLRDGWGRTFGFDLTGGVLTVASLGSDGDSDLPEDSYDKDIQLRIELADYSTATVMFHVRELDTSGNELDPALAGDENLILRLYAVNPATGQAVLNPVTVNETTFQHALANVAVGTLAVRALVLDGSNNITKKSAPCYLTVRPRSNLYQKLIVR